MFVLCIPYCCKVRNHREGDAPTLIGSSDKAQKILGWSPQYSDLKQMIANAWQWHQKRHGG